MVDAEPAQPSVWTRNTFGLDLLNERETWEVLAILEHHGATVDRRGNATYPLALDGTMRAAVAQWISRRYRVGDWWYVTGCQGFKLDVENPRLRYRLAANYVR